MYDRGVLVVFGTTFVFSVLSNLLKGQAPDRMTAFFFVLLVLLGVLTCWLIRKVEAMEQTNALRKSTRQMSDDPCVLRLQEGGTVL